MKSSYKESLSDVTFKSLLFHIPNKTANTTFTIKLTLIPVIHAIFYIDYMSLNLGLVYYATLRTFILFILFILKLYLFKYF